MAEGADGAHAWPAWVRCGGAKLGHILIYTNPPDGSHKKKKKKTWLPTRKRSDQGWVSQREREDERVTSQNAVTLHLHGLVPHGQ